MKKFKCIFVHTPQLTLNQNGNVCSNINFSAMGLYSLANELNKEGFPTEIIHLGIEKYLDKKTIRIPMLPTLRSLNLSNSVAIITYEILRQHDFEDLQGVSNYFEK